jgi:hypothetical protein
MAKASVETSQDMPVHFSKGFTDVECVFMFLKGECMCWGK